MQERRLEMGAPADSTAPSVGSASAVPETGFAEALKDGMKTVETSIGKTNEVHLDVINGDLDIHEVAAQLKESEITFQFALTVRNKLMDAYREVMRMSV